MKEALFYKKLNSAKVSCQLCPHNCLIMPDCTGICRSRKNIDGTLYALNYGKTVTVAVDPIEKKPLYHFHPGSKILSIGPNSCNLDCDFCQNYEISQGQSTTYDITPETVYQLCLNHGLEMVAFTYTEPITWFEFVLDSSKFLKEKGIKTVMVTNGFINEKPLKALLPYLDALNIDLKAMDEDFYANICQAELAPVLESIKIANNQAHVEVTNLIVTGENDKPLQLEKLVDFIASVDVNLPLHFSKYFPQYKRSSEPTSDGTMEIALEIGLRKLNYVYLGNMFSCVDSRCPECDELLIRRLKQTECYLEDGCCPNCGLKIQGEFA